MKKITLIFILCFVFTGCSRALTVDERLEGKTGTARHQELYYMCLERSNDPISGGGRYAFHENRRGTLCREMQKLNGQSKNQDRFVLAEECRQNIEMGLIKDDTHNVRQHKIMQRICEEMTGKSIEVQH